MNKPIYHDWLITEPTTRRLHCEELCWPGEFAGTDAEGLRFFLTGDSNGDNNLYIVPSTKEDCDRISVASLPCPATRFGSWSRVRAVIAWARAVFGLLGYEPTEQETALLAALEDYAQQAPARYVTAA